MMLHVNFVIYLVMKSIHNDFDFTYAHNAFPIHDVG